MRRAVHTLIAFVGCVVWISLLLNAQSSQVASSTWAPGGTMAQTRTGAAAALLQDGRVLITGGIGVNGATATAELFRSTGGFAAAAPMNVARTGHSSVALRDGRVLVTGGTTVNGAATRTAEARPRRCWPMDGF
jgi:hypothetical protein